MYKENGQSMLKHVSKSVSFKHVLYIKIAWSLRDAASDLVLRFLDGDRESVLTTPPGSPQLMLWETCSKQCHRLPLLPLLTECQDAQSRTVFLGTI